MSQTSDIDWKQLEVKPDNWEMIQILIGSATSLTITTSSKDGVSSAASSGFFFDAVFVLEHLIGTRWADYRASGVYKETVICLEEIKNKGRIVAKNKTASRSKKDAAAPLKKADIIRLKNAQRMMIKDLDKMHFEECRPKVFLFQYDVSFVIMNLEWWAMLESADAKTDLWTEAIVAGDRVCKRLVTDKESALADWIRRVYDNVLGRKRSEEQLLHLFRNPKLMMYSVAEKCVGSVELYDKQKELILMVTDAVINDTPILIGNRMPPGTGKTFLAVPLAQALQPLHRPKTVLFCCPNILVRQYVASIALLGHDLHLWMGCYTRSSSHEEFFMIRPHKRCFPSIWKQVYKEQSAQKYGDVYEQFDYYYGKTNRTPDILVCDPKTCLALLSVQSRRDAFIAYVDEVIGTGETTRVMTSILYNLPMHSVIMSAILPRFENIPFLPQHFTTCHPHAIIHMVDASGVTISCSMIGPDGRLNLPHHYTDDRVDIPILIESLQEDPLTRRMYAPVDVLEMSKRLSVSNRSRYSEICRWDLQLPALGNIEYANVLTWWIKILQVIYSSNDENAWAEIQGYRPLILGEAPDFSKILADHAYMFPGKHLHIMQNDGIHKQYTEMGALHLLGCPEIHILRRKRDNVIQLMNTRLQKIHDQKLTRAEKDRVISEWSDDFRAVSQIEWPSMYVINSTAHYTRFHPERTSIPQGIGMRRAYILEKTDENAFDDIFGALVMSGSILYEERNFTEHQRRIILRLMDHMNFIMSGEELVFGTNIDGLTGLSIEKSFGLHYHRSVLYQLIGRTGRSGMSYHARVVIDSDEVLRKIMKPEIYSQPEDDPDVRSIMTAWPSEKCK